MEVDDKRYEELIAAESKAKSLEPEVDTLRQEIATKDKAIEDAEAKVVKAEGERDAEKKAREEAEEKERRASLKSERFETLSQAFTTKLDSMPTTKARLEREAQELDDDKWKERLAELKESTTIDPLDKSADTEGDPANNGGGDPANNGGGGGDQTAGLLFDKEVVASSRVNDGSNGDREREPSPAAVSTVVGDLFG